MSDDVVRIVPCSEQSTEEVAEILSQAAAAQGLEGEVQIDGDDVIVPRSLSVASVRGIAGFPPPPQGMNPDGSSTGGQLYQLQKPIDLREAYGPGGTAGAG
ncbi:hypothetical protein [Streptomyces sp. NPDC012746]|uniref:hypothetical protein n=1 Tax=Streptomyces sp. NPDC012746 TaxID=3364845 RepID=UPI0036B57395